ncbi:MAG: EcsC family protein [Acetobacteraceae bacterium]|nr:EcsC family protein [Acetobacteraceae bacterium]
MADGSILKQGLDWLYDRVAGDLGAATVPAGKEGDIDHWIRLACTQAGAAGFVTNLGGVLTLPVALPANFLGTAAVQMRLIAKIASARGYDLESDEVKAFVFACLLGNAAVDALKDAGIRIGMRLGPAVLQRLNQNVLSRLVVRLGAAGAVNLTRLVPLLGGVIGGGLDAASTRVVGRMAKRVFVRREPEPAGEAPALLAGPQE